MKLITPCAGVQRLAPAVGLMRSGGNDLATLRSLITAEWRFNEAAGANDAVDSIGSRNLTQHGSPGSAAGQINNARTLASASSQYFSRDVSADGPANISGVNVSISTWFKLTSITSAFSDILAIRDIPTTALLHVLLRVPSASSHLELLIGDGNGLFDTYTVSSLLVSNAWHHLAFSLNSSTKECRYRYDGGAVVSNIGTVYPGNATGKNFCVGGAAAEFCDGLADRTRLYSGTILSDAQLLLDFNDTGQG